MGVKKILSQNVRVVPHNGVREYREGQLGDLITSLGREADHFGTVLVSDWLCPPLSALDVLNDQRPWTFPMMGRPVSNICCVGGIQGFYLLWR